MPKKGINRYVDVDKNLLEDPACLRAVDPDAEDFDEAVALI